MRTVVSVHWHHLPMDEVLDLLEADVDRGLDTFEVTRRQEHFGPNELIQRKGQGPLIRFLLQFHQPLIYILVAAAIVTALLQEWVDSGVILAVVLVNAIVGFIQEAKAQTAIEALAKSLTSQATVIRAGRKVRVSSSELVPGDVVVLQSGDKVPADLRLSRTRDIQIDESTLTGESLPVEKRSGVVGHDTPLADRKNMVYSSTLVTYGTATGVVTATGNETEIGQISQMLASAVVLATPLTRKIEHFSHVLLFAILALTALTVGVGLLRGQPWLDTFMAAVALAVGAIPEGLPAAVTIILAIGVSRMAKRQAIIRSLPAVETLGSTTVICSDKTGTLTQNQMTVQEILAGGERYEVSGVGYAPDGTITKADDKATSLASEALRECLACGLLCNDSMVVHDNGLWNVQGDPTEGALIVSARKGELCLEELQGTLPRIDTIPFESQHRYMATLHDSGNAKQRVTYLKGSVESILTKCVSAMGRSGERIQLDVDQIHEQTEKLAAEGLRVLAFGRKEFPQHTRSIGHTDVVDGVTFLGLQAMIDPPRPEAARAIATCQSAGIRVKMITGDHAVTACAIARQIGIGGTHDVDQHAAVLTGKELGRLSDSELIDAAERTAIFARVSPDHKLRIVEALQARGQIVAMTGDGVNDAPALRRADIGVAMALGGTEVAREASDMVLTDDNFASIEAAVEEGRGVFDNLMKFIVWTLPTNGGEGLVIMLAILLGVALPILPVQILWINMTTAGCLGLLLAFEPNERGIMKRPPRTPGTPLLTGLLWQRIVLVSGLLCLGAFGVFEWELGRDASEAEARTAAVAVFVVGELFYLLNCRSLNRSMFALGLFSNPWLWPGVVFMMTLQLLFTYHPLMNRLFHSAPLAAEAWVGITAVGLSIYTIIGFEKWIRNQSLNGD